MKYKLLFLLIFLPTLLFSQGNYNLEWQYNYGVGESFYSLIKMKKNYNPYHIVIGNYEANIAKMYDGNTHNLDYTHILKTSDTMTLNYGFEPKLDQNLSKMDVNNDGVYELIRWNHYKCQIINGANGQLIKEIIYPYSTVGGYNIYTLDIDGDGFVELCINSSPTFFVYSTPSVVSINENNEIIPDFKLKQNYPNPFNPTTKIDFSISKNASVKLVLYDINGKEISTLLNESRNAGSYSEIVNGNNLSTGTYFYQLTVDGVAEAKKMILIK